MFVISIDFSSTDGVFVLLFPADDKLKSSVLLASTIALAVLVFVLFGIMLVNFLQRTKSDSPDMKLHGPKGDISMTSIHGYMAS